MELHVTGGHLSEVPVLAGPQVKHPALEVGQLEHQPVAVHHVAGLHVRHVVAVLDGLAVGGQFVHLALEVWPLVDPHPEGPLVL